MKNSLTWFVQTEHTYVATLVLPILGIMFKYLEELLQINTTYPSERVFYPSSSCIFFRLVVIITIRFILNSVKIPRESGSVNTPHPTPKKNLPKWLSRKNRTGLFLWENYRRIRWCNHIIQKCQKNVLTELHLPSCYPFSLSHLSRAARGK